MRSDHSPKLRSPHSLYNQTSMHQVLNPISGVTVNGKHSITASSGGKGERKKLQCTAFAISVVSVLPPWPIPTYQHDIHQCAKFMKIYQLALPHMTKASSALTPTHPCAQYYIH